MGLLDFFKKGEEKPVQQPAPKVTSAQPAAVPTGKQQPVSPTSTPAVQEYVIQGGDSLSKIAKQIYGDAQKWNIIFEANRDTIKNPDLIHPGQKLKIPKI